MSEPEKKTAGLIIAGVSCALVGGIYAVATPFVLPALRKICLPYVPATTKQVSNVMGVLQKHNKIGTVIDLGSGDGRIVCFSLYDLFTYCDVYKCFIRNERSIHWSALL